MQKSYAGSIALTKMKHAVITTAKGTRAILLPIDENFLTEKDGAVYMSVGVVTKTEADQYGQNGFISHKLSSEKYKELGAELAKDIKLPILGNIKDFSGGGGADASGAMTAEEAQQYSPSEENTDDIPF
jgi:hypothetical protein